jgi:hypothetical protein
MGKRSTALCVAIVGAMLYAILAIPSSKSQNGSMSGAVIAQSQATVTCAPGVPTKVAVCRGIALPTNLTPPPTVTPQPPPGTPNCTPTATSVPGVPPTPRYPPNCSQVDDLDASACSGSINLACGDPICFDCFEQGKDYFIDKYLDSSVRSFARTCISYTAEGIPEEPWFDAYGCRREEYGGNAFIHSCERGAGITIPAQRTIGLNGVEGRTLLHELAHMFSREPWAFTCGGPRAGGYFLHFQRAIEQFLNDPNNADGAFGDSYAFLYCYYPRHPFDPTRFRDDPSQYYSALHMYAILAGWLLECNDKFGGSYYQRMAKLPPELRWYFRGFLNGADVPGSPAVPPFWCWQDTNGDGVIGAGDTQVRCSCPEDVNGDGFIDIDDLTFISNRYGCQIAQACYDPRADINGDGKIDLFDIVTIAGQQFGTDVTPHWPTTSCQPIPSQLTSCQPNPCGSQYLIYASSTISGFPNDEPNAAAKGYALEAISGQPYIPSSEMGQLLPGNLIMKAEYIRLDTKQRQVMELAIYPTEARIEANALAAANPPTITFEHNVPLIITSHQRYYRVYATMPPKVTVGGYDYCLQGTMWAVLPIESGGYTGVTLNGQSRAGSPILQPVPAWILPCTSSQSPTGLTTIHLTEASAAGGG